jgi:hypothetical protein
VRGFLQGIDALGAIFLLLVSVRRSRLFRVITRWASVFGAGNRQPSVVVDPLERFFLGCEAAEIMHGAVRPLYANTPNTVLLK